MNQIVYSPKAQADLDAIWDYISEKLMNPTAAENTVNGILDTVDMLKTSQKLVNRFTSHLDFTVDIVISFTRTILPSTEFLMKQSMLIVLSMADEIICGCCFTI